MNTAENLNLTSMPMDELSFIIDQHALWLKSEGREGRRANLAEQNLCGVSLRGIYMPEANFRGANLIGADFEQANVQGADFSGALLENANFREASLDAANFEHAQVQGAYFDNAHAVQVNFSNACLEGISATEANLAGCNFRDASLSNSNFTGCLLLRANLRFAKAEKCVFDTANLTQADCRDVVFDFASFKGATLEQANMRSASFEQVLFTDADFTHVVDLSANYHSAAMELEKESIRHEIENLAQIKEEVESFKEKITQQRQEIAHQRKVLGSLNGLESEVNDSLMKQMIMLRRIAMFWFMVVALIATVFTLNASKIEALASSFAEMAAMAALFGVILLAHVFTAVFSYRAARLFARYLRKRQVMLSEVTIGSDSTELSSDVKDSAVTYL